MTISWVSSSGESGIAENEYDYAMQHQQMSESQAISDAVPRRSEEEKNWLQRTNKGDLPEQTPQTRIDNAFDITPPKRMFDQNNPLTWGLGEVINNYRQDMEDPGATLKQQRIQEELNSEIDRTPLERQASLEQQLGDPSQISTSTYQQFADYVHDLRVKFTGEPDKWSGKEVVGDFLDKAMSVMGGGIRRPPKGGLGKGLTSSIGEERITSAAMKVGDKVYEGENHGIAYEKAGDHHPAMAVEEGFTTSKGRFVSREEAAKIAKGQEQVLLEARQTENLHSGELKPGFERVPQTTKEPSQAQWSKYEELSSQGKTTKQILKATKMDPEVVRDSLGRDNLALAAFNSENALTQAYFNQLKTMSPELEKALRAKGVSVKDLKRFTRSLPEEDLAQIFQQLPPNIKTWWEAGELRRQKIDEGKKGTQIPKGSSEGEPLGPKPPRGTVKAGWDDLRANNDNKNIGSQKNLQKQKSLENMTEKEFQDYLASREEDFVKSGGLPEITKQLSLKDLFNERTSLIRKRQEYEVRTPEFEKLDQQINTITSKIFEHPDMEGAVKHNSAFKAQQKRKTFKLVPKE